MHFTSETSSNGVIERNFILDEITGVLWSPTPGTAGSLLLLAGHSGGMHKKAPGLVASAFHSVTAAARRIPISSRATPLTTVGFLRRVATGCKRPDDRRQHTGRVRRMRLVANPQ